MRKLPEATTPINAVEKRRNISLNEAFLISEEKSPQMLALDEALGKLEQLQARQGQVVDLRLFVGLTVEEDCRGDRCFS